MSQIPNDHGCTKSSSIEPLFVQFMHHLCVNSRLLFNRNFLPLQFPVELRAYGRPVWTSDNVSPMFKITAATNICLTSEVSPISDLPAKNQVLNSVLLRHSFERPRKQSLTIQQRLVSNSMLLALRCLVSRCMRTEIRPKEGRYNPKEKPASPTPGSTHNDAL